ncbi:TIGR01777 family oxidoreductase [Amphibiibacter pelophylacis]|uniref:TIGR01777 family oxidoreductase n=1 Tax=Amphibiibacter pelophylacis TaxID=1799477 RepID=A0ACC6P2H9_9BURK
MKVFMTGGTGLLGQALCRALLARGDQVWVYSRRPAQVAALCGAGVQAVASLEGPVAQLALGCEVWINLAGESIAGGRWTPARQALLRASRIGVTRQLQALAASASAASQGQITGPRVILSGSAIGIYGDTGAQALAENQTPPAAPGFAAALCREWEAAAQALGEALPQARLVLLRTGLVMARQGGLWPQLKRPALLGLAARLGDGQQYQSWIHIDDWVRAALALMDARCNASGPVNLVAPQPLTQADFTRRMAWALGRPQWLCVPGAALRLALGELADLVLDGQRVQPARLLGEGATWPGLDGQPFLYPDWDSALRDLVR